jgi:hypothetical protein
VLLAATIFAESSRSQLAGPSGPGDDKVEHFAVYGLLGTIIIRVWPGRWTAWMSILLVSAYGASDEWHQHFTPGRSMEVADWVADTLGAACAIILYSCWTKYRRALETPIRLRRKNCDENASRSQQLHSDNPNQSASEVFPLRTP